MSKNVIISGASKGIGKAITFAFARQGCKLFLGARNLNDLHTTKQEIISTFPDASVFIKEVDFSQKSSIEIFVKEAQVLMPEVNVIVNNVGQYIEDTAADYQPEKLDNMMRVNFYAAYHLTNPLLSKMRARKQGHLFNILSIASLDLVKKASSYSISKYALYGWHKLLKEELRSHMIKVTGIFPGPTISDSWKNESIDEKKFIKAEEIAEVVIQAFNMPYNVNMEDIVIRPLTTH